MAKEEIIFDFKIEQGGAIAELEKTKKSIIGLKEEQAELNKAYKQGNITLDEYSSETVRVDQVLKKQTKTYSDLTHQVQGTQSMTDKLTGSLRTMAPGLSSSIDGIKGMTTAALKFIATPLGLILAAIAAALALVVTALKRSEPVLDFFEDIVSKITTAIDFLINNLKAIATVLGQAFVGNLGAAKEGLDKLSKGFVEAQKQAQLYLNIQRELEDKSARVRIETAGMENQIKSLIIASKNRNLTLIEQQDLLKEAAKLESELVAKRSELANQEAIIGIKQIALKRDLKQLDSESFDEFVKRLIASNDLSKEEKDNIAELFEKRQQAASAGLALQEKIQNSSDAALDKDLARIEKLEAARQKAFEAELKRNEDLATFNEERRAAQEAQDEADIEANAEKFQTNLEREVADNEELSNLKIDIEQDAAEQTNEIQTSLTGKQKQAAIDANNLKLDLMKKGMTAEQAELSIHRMVEDQKLAATSNTLGSVASLLKKNTVAYKVIATAQATIDTYQSAVSAFKAMSGIPYIGPVLGGIAAAAAIAAGLANIAQINGVALAGGGKFTTKGPTLLLVGDNPGGRERVEVTPLSGKGTTRTFGRSGLAMAGGGSIDGSILAAASTQNIDTQFALQDGASNLPPIYVSWTEKIEFENKMAFKAQLTEK